MKKNCEVYQNMRQKLYILRFKLVSERKYLSANEIIELENEIDDLIYNIKKYLFDNQNKERGMSK